MTTTDPNAPTVHVTDSIAAYLAGGLSPAERARFEAHLGLCAACAAAVADMERADVRFRDLFAAVRPPEGFEDEVVDRFRGSAAAEPLPFPAGKSVGRVGKLMPAMPAMPRLPRPVLHPMVRLAVSGIAAAVVLGAIGLGVTHGGKDLNLSFLNEGPRVVDGKLTWGSPNPVSAGQGRAQNNLRQLALGASMYSGSPVASPTELARRTRLSLTENAVLDLAGGLDDKEAAVAEREKLMQSRDAAAGKRLPSQAMRRQLGGTDQRATGATRSLSESRKDLEDLSKRNDRGEAAQDGPSAGSESYYRAARPQAAGATPSSGVKSESFGLEFRDNIHAATNGPVAGSTVTAGKPSSSAGAAPAGGPGGHPEDATDVLIVPTDNAAALGIPAQPGGVAQGLQQGQQRGRQPEQAAAGQAVVTNGSASSMTGIQPQGGGFGGFGAVRGGFGGGGGAPGAGGVPAGVPAGTAGHAAVTGGRAYSYEFQERQEQNEAKAAKTEALSDQAGKPVTPAASEAGASNGRGLQADLSTWGEGHAFKPAELAKQLGAGIESKGEVKGDAKAGDNLGRASQSALVKAAESAKPGEPAVKDAEQAAEKAQTPPPPDRPLNAKDADGDGVKDAKLIPPPQVEGKPPAESAGVAAQPTEPAAPAAPAHNPAPAETPNGPNGRPAAQSQVQSPAAEPIKRKIIRNGEMTFEVDSFDSSAMQVAKIVTEERGFVATTDSEKLPNGKVKGTIIVRCPPENLDTLVLKLRGLGDLKNQKIAAQDITKQYTDLESQLKAANTMRDRLLEIIKSGKGEVKDLVAAEKELGVWQEKIDALEGEIRYYNNLVALSTLSVTLFERDIKTPTAAAEVETVQMGVETEDVEKSRAAALKAVEEAKGRIVQAEMKKHEAGQLAATIVAEVPPDASGPLIDRLKQLGKVARLEIDRRRETAGGTGPITPSVKLERRDTRFQVSLYNLANIAPRQTTSLNLAAADVEKAYRAILDQVNGGGGRIVASQLNRPKPDQTTGTINFEVPADKADVLLAAIRGNGDVMRMEVTQNPDTQNVTEAKRGFAIQVFSLASVAPRETTSLQLAASSVSDAFNKLLEAAKAGGGRIITSQLNEQDLNNVTAQLDFDVMREQWGSVEAALRQAGLVVTRMVARSPDTENTVDSKVRLQIGLFDTARLQPRETITLTIATRTVPEAFNTLLNLARDAGGRAVSTQLNQQQRTGTAAIQVPRENWDKLQAALKVVGVVVNRSVTRAADGPMTVDTKVGLSVSVVDERSIQAREAQSMTVLTAGVAERYNRVLELLRSMDAQIYDAKLTEQGANDLTGILDFAVRREDRAAVEKALFDQSDVFDRHVERSQDVQNTLENKVRYTATLKDAERQPPRETFTIAVEVPDVDKAAGDLEAAVMAVRGRRVDATASDDKGKRVTRIVADVPLAAAGQILNTVRGYGTVTMRQQTRNAGVPEGNLSRARVEVTLGTPETIVKGDESLAASIREGLRTSAYGLMWSLRLVIIGLCLVLPWVIILWAVWRVARRRRTAAGPITRTPPGPTMTPPSEPPAPPPGGPIVAPA